MTIQLMYFQTKQIMQMSIQLMHFQTMQEGLMLLSFSRSWISIAQGKDACVCACVRVFGGEKTRKEKLRRQQNTPCII